MLFFIRNERGRFPWAVLFKYISCYSLSRAMQERNVNIGEFKYISCYSLSSLRRSWTKELLNLNTSHVILYLRNAALRIVSSIFKYISCYSLSKILFRYNINDIYLNTSHVILYHFSIYPCDGCKQI